MWLSRPPLAASLVLACVAASCTALARANPPVRSLADLTETVLAQHDVPGIAVLMLDGGRVIASGVAGTRRVGCPSPATLDDEWHLGSCGKAMTATLVALLVAEGRLRFDSTVAELLPDLAPDMHPGARSITVRHLLDHRAGLPANERAGSSFTRQLTRDATPSEQRLEIATAALTAPPISAPGTRRVYANTGYLIAGAIIERVTGTSWETALQQRLFAPLGITSAGFGQPAMDDTQPRGHTRTLGRTIAASATNPLVALPAYYGPSGDVHMSLPDWAKFVRAHLGPGLLDARMLATMHAGEDDYACGFSITRAEWANGPVLAHHGSSAHWHALVALDPATGRGVLAACNQGGDAGSAACTDLMARAAVALPGR